MLINRYIVLATLSIINLHFNYTAQYELADRPVFGAWLE